MFMIIVALATTRSPSQHHYLEFTEVKTFRSTSFSVTKHKKSKINVPQREREGGRVDLLGRRPPVLAVKSSLYLKYESFGELICGVFIINNPSIVVY